MFKRQLQLPRSGSETFFLWGPRQTGKTTLLQATYPDAMWIDLLKADQYRRYMQNPELLRGELSARPSIRQVVIDEVQKVPHLLDEVHWLHENHSVQFALCGSSARKVKRGQDYAGSSQRSASVGARSASNQASRSCLPGEQHSPDR